MKFSRPKRGRQHVQIIPMIDILLVLLIFFIAATQFKKGRPVVQIDLPVVKEIATEKVMVERSVLGMSKGGKVFLDKVEVPDGLLGDYLVAFRKQNPGRELEIEVDKDTPMQGYLTLLDGLQKAGVETRKVPTRIVLPGS